MKNIIPYITLILILICSCKKEVNDGPTVVFGTVLDAKTKKPMEGVSIFWESGTKIDNHTTLLAKTDKEGKFYVKAQLYDHYFGPEVSYPYNDLFYAYYDDYIEGYIMFEKYKTIGVNLELSKYSYLKIYFKNLAPYNNEDKIRYWLGPENGSGAYSFPWDDYSYKDGILTLKGMNVDTLICRKVDPDITYSLVWEVTKDSIQVRSDTNVYMPWGDTVHFSINY
jgi:hypothetical protein